MNLVLLSSLSLAAFSLAAPAVAAVAPSNAPLAVRSAPDLPFEQRADEGAPATHGELFHHDGSTDSFSARDEDGLYKRLRVTLDADTILGTANLYAVVYTDGNAWERLFTTDDFAIHGAAPAEGDLVEADLVSGHSSGLCGALEGLHPASP